MKHQVTVPAGVDPTSIDPKNPQDWPAGTRVQMDEKDFNGGTVGVGHGKFGLEASVEGSKGTSIVMEKTSQNTVDVTVGPTEAFTNGGTLKFKPTDGVEAKVSAGGTNESVHYKKFTVDTSKPGGSEVLDNVVSGKNLPANNGDDADNVSNYHEVRINSKSVEASAKLKLPGIEFGASSTPHPNQQTVVTTYPDGRAEYRGTVDINGDGKPEGIETRTSTDGGNTWSDPTLKMRHTVNESSVDQQYWRNVTGRQDLQAGDVVEVEMTKAEIDTMREASNSPYTRKQAGEGEAEAIRDRGRFLTNLAHQPQNELMQYTFRTHQLPPGTYTVHKG